MSATANTLGKETVNREEELAFLFAQLVLQQSNMAMMLLGKVAHPESGKVIQDIEAARLFIDQLEMLEVKTKGNLSKEEETLLKQTLMTLRLNFVEAVEPSTSASAEKQTKEPATPAEPSKSNQTEGSQPSGDSGAQEDEHRKKFSKKY
jgi:hypothetical protein